MSAQAMASARGDMAHDGRAALPHQFPRPGVTEQGIGPLGLHRTKRAPAMPIARRIFVSMPADRWLDKNQNALKWGIVQEIQDLGYTPEIFTNPKGMPGLTGIFLFTKDDPLTTETQAYKAVPRDNVVFEAGYFINAKGKEHVLIVLGTGAKMPADLERRYVRTT